VLRSCIYDIPPAPPIVPPTRGRNVGWRGGAAPARIYIPELLKDAPAGTIDPGRAFEYETDLEHSPDAYRAMDQRRAIKSLIGTGSI
jgi:hypothetical protein